jgi:dephospho-CoA kinase
MDKQQTSPYIVKEAALLFESGAHKYLDRVIGVFAPAELRIERTMQRDHVTREEVLQRMSRQMNEEEKMKLCNYVVTNDEQKLVLPQVLELHKQFLGASA